MDCNRVKSRSFPLICATDGGWSVVAAAEATGVEIGFVVEFDISCCGPRLRRSFRVQSVPSDQIIPARKVGERKELKFVVAEFPLAIGLVSRQQSQLKGMSFARILLSRVEYAASDGAACQARTFCRGTFIPLGSLRWAMKEEGKEHDVYYHWSALRTVHPQLFLSRRDPFPGVAAMET